jgi:predicted nucleic acid-binding protein
VTPSGAYVVDASVVIKWYVPEPDHARATALLGSGRRLLAPDLLLPEVGNVVWKKVGRGELTVKEGEEIVDALTSNSPVTLTASGPYLRSAYDIATAFQRTVNDALYLAVAIVEGCPFVTADERLVNALSGSALAPFITPLKSL